MRVFLWIERVTFVAIVSALAVAGTGSARGAGPVVDAHGRFAPPATVDGTTGTATAIAVGMDQSCAIQAGSGKVVCWPISSKATPPASVNGTTGAATAIAVGWSHGCAIQKGTARVVCWGDAAPGSAVDGTAGTATAIADGPFFSCAIQAGTGKVVCWGSAFQARRDLPRSFREFDENQRKQLTPPGTVDGTTGTATAIAVGMDESCAIQARTGKVICWGQYADDGFGRPPAAVNGVDGTATALAVGSKLSGTPAICAIQAGTGKVVCWGDDPDPDGAAWPPAAVNGVDGTATAIAVGMDQSCAIQAGSGKVICWGDNQNGQATPPREVNGLAGTATAIAAGGSDSCAIQAGTAKVICWGGNTYGQATPPAGVDGTTGTASAIAAGGDHTLAIRTAPEPDASLLGGIACAALFGIARRRRDDPPKRVDRARGEG